MMDCIDIRELILKLIERELTVREIRSIRSHTAHCESCRNEFERLESLQLKIKQSFASIPTDIPDFTQSIMSNLPVRSMHENRKSWTWRWVAIPAVFFACILLVMILQLGHHSIPTHGERTPIAKKPAAGDKPAHSTLPERVLHKDIALEIAVNPPKSDLGAETVEIDKRPIKSHRVRGASAHLGHNTAKIYNVNDKKNKLDLQVEIAQNTVAPSCQGNGTKIVTRIALGGLAVSHEARNRTVELQPRNDEDEIVRPVLVACAKGMGDPDTCAP